MTRAIWAGVGIVALAVAVAAQAQWSDQGWGPGNGGMGLGRTEGNVMVDISAFGSETNVAVTVSACGGPRDQRTFCSVLDGGERQFEDLAATLDRLLGDARRVCALEEGLPARIVQGLAPAYVAWQAEQAAMNAMDMNMAVECSAEECNAM